MRDDYVWTASCLRCECEFHSPSGSESHDSDDCDKALAEQVLDS